MAFSVETFVAVKKYVAKTIADIGTISGGKGDKGDKGADGTTPQFKKTNTAIQISLDNGKSFTDLVLLSEIKGEKGDKGDKGENGASGKDGVKGETGASVTAMTFSKDFEGNIVSGIATLNDGTSINISVNNIEE